jgi:peptide/nickel transport system ATP-binding protein
LLRLEQSTSGEIQFDGINVVSAEGDDLKAYRRKVQVIFQDPYSSLNPRMTIGQIIAEPMLVYRLVPDRKAAQARVMDLLSQVGLFDYMAERYPHELSGGQRQRVGIARALAMEPRVLLYDEPTSALDPSMKGEVLSALKRVDATGVTQVVVTHDVQLAKAMEQVCVLDAGVVVETGEPQLVLGNPVHESTRKLLGAWNATVHPERA